MTEVVLLIACYNGRRCLGDCLHSLLESCDEDIQTRIVVVDNASADGSADLISRDFPGVRLIRLPENLGFTGAINAGWKYARQEFPAARFVGALNQDIIARDGWLAALVTHLEQNPRVAAVQPKVLLWPKTGCLNTAGNQSHFLGFGLVTAYGQLDDGSYDACREIDFPSGAAILIRADSLGNSDILDDLFFLYLEDAELGWRLRQLGFRIDYVPTAAIWHQYSFRHDYRYYFFLERNRWLLLAMYYKTPTLLLLSPAILAMEAGQIFFAWRNGVLDQKLKACGFFLSSSNLSRLLKRRRAAQRRRRIGDREFMGRFLGEIDLPELRSRTLRTIGNPVLRAYWRVVRSLIVW